jgi:hypothetical protein
MSHGTDECPEPSRICPVERANLVDRVRTLEVRVSGVDGGNGLQGRVKELEGTMQEQLTAFSKKLESMEDSRNNRLRLLEMRVYLILGVPGIVTATIMALAFLGMLHLKGGQ